MTLGQQRALRELNNLHSADPPGFEILGEPIEHEGRLVTMIGLRLGPMQTAEGGLSLREYEEFLLLIPADFPFAIPTLRVEHDRFARFPHVIWTHTLCLYQSKMEWYPPDGLYGFFDRLQLWLGKAAVNDMDPTDGPLEPPHHDTDFSQKSYVIRENAPVPAGETWFGIAELEEFPNRIELVRWNDLSKGGPKDHRLALAVILSDRLPMEFPTLGSEFFNELSKQGIDRDRVLKWLGWAALLSPPESAIHLILGFPMRRAPDGSPRQHIAVWTTRPAFTKVLQAILPNDADTPTMSDFKKDVTDLLYDVFAKEPIKWCPVLEDRNEILIRRDKDRPISWFAGKKVLILGCGALGSWAAEIIARANASQIHLVDQSIVKPGLISRQNYELDDIGSNKAVALARRIGRISKGTTVISSASEAHKFIFSNLGGVKPFDVILDFTASSIFQMKLERDWNALRIQIPSVISVIVDAECKRAICVRLPSKSIAGIWDAYLRLKVRLCSELHWGDLMSAFYSDQAIKKFFQPEPGCSEPTFSGSSADVLSLISTSLNVTNEANISPNQPVGFVVSMASCVRPSTVEAFDLPGMQEIQVGSYRVRVAQSVFVQSRYWVQQNNRLRSPKHETGGLIWGYWDDATQVVWIFDASGPPSDSQHQIGYFQCGAQGTVEEHKRRMQSSFRTVGFIGFWHTHPGMSPSQSSEDIHTMLELTSQIGENNRRGVMIIFGSRNGQSSADLHVYECHFPNNSLELVSVGVSHVHLQERIV